MSEDINMNTSVSHHTMYIAAAYGTTIFMVSIYLIQLFSQRKKFLLWLEELASEERSKENV